MKLHVTVGIKLYILSIYTYNFFLFFSGNGKISSWGAVIGFVVMMSLDVGLG
jgi:hypothetical protein